MTLTSTSVYGYRRLVLLLQLLSTGIRLLKLQQSQYQAQTAGSGVSVKPFSHFTL
jgi:hypothetical protein